MEIFFFFYQFMVMKKYYYFFFLCLYLSTNLYCDCDGGYINYDDYFVESPREYYCSNVGASDTLIIVSNEPEFPVLDFDWVIEQAIDYDWHSEETRETVFKGLVGNPDSIDGGWFQLKKVVDNCWSGLQVKVLPNGTGKNRHAEVKLYHPSDYKEAYINIFQDCK